MKKYFQSHCLPVLGDKSMQGFPGYFLCSSTSNAAACCGDRQDADGMAGLGLTHRQFSLAAGHLLRNGGGLGLHGRACLRKGRPAVASMRRFLLEQMGKINKPSAACAGRGFIACFRINLKILRCHLLRWQASYRTCCHSHRCCKCPRRPYPAQAPLYCKSCR